FGRGEFTEPFPRAVVVFWSLVAAAIVGFSVWQFVLVPRLWPSKRTSESDGARAKIE
ncbi:hypothetical protein LPJ57_002180, partial [Coemansia sp. RSA 486]